MLVLKMWPRNSQDILQSLRPVVLPSSLSLLLPLALGFSPSLPVSVIGTGPKNVLPCTVWYGARLRSFFQRLKVAQIVLGNLGLCVVAQLNVFPDFPEKISLQLTRLRLHQSAWNFLSCYSPNSNDTFRSTGISTCCSSTTPPAGGLVLVPD